MDMEKYWDIVSLATGICSIAAAGYLFYRFTEPYLSGKNRAKIVGLSYFVVMTMLYLIPWEMDGFAAYGLGALAAFIVMCVVDCQNRKQKLFLTLIMYLMDKISHGVANIPRSALFEKILYRPDIQEHLWLQLFCYMLIEIFFLAVSFFIMTILIRMVNKVYACKKENIQGRELALMLATPLLAFTGYAIFLYFSNIWLGTFGHYIWNVYEKYLWVEALYQMVSYIAILTTIMLYQGIKDSHRQEKENAVLAGHMADMKRHIGQMEAVYGDIRGLKHDMGNHVLILEGLLERKEHQEAAAYLSDLKEQLNEIEKEIKTGNPVTDVILSEKQKEAWQKGIEFLCDFHYPEESKINAFDVSIILNNALDNAIEAAGSCEKSFIHIRSWQQKNAYMLEVRNSFAGGLVTEGGSGLPASTKSAAEHGFGLKNIQKVARRYFGDIDIRQEENTFILNVMLMLK